MAISHLSAILALVASAVAAPTGILPLSERAGNTTGVQFVGTNIAGFDFGCSIQGECNTIKISPPLSNLGGADGPGQMQHFAKDDGWNMFRLPVGWQYLVNNKVGGNLDSGNLQKYDQLVQACLRTGAYCVIDIHNYARWNGQIIGQGGPSNEQFVSLWTQLASKYASNSKMAFGIMNEPHDVPDIDKWADTVQAVVTAIRNAGAKTQMILIPGNDWTSAQAFPTKSGPALLKVKNPDGSTDGLIFDVHKYLDSDNSGTHTECVTDNVSSAFEPLANWLRENNRQAINSETGGGNTASCQKYLCQQIQFLNQNADVFLGYTGWSAGSFNPQTYELSEVPSKNGNNWQDTSLVRACMVKKK
ncbi:glycoside hydrolase family 5 protein [Rhypophila decipiens]|uniref:Endoglucanase EG-II n=1 Tax=Rhypophila decipiens TaxID=261697 RepID=A0AAN6XXY9_9PEZI|nr:glycoside hydrolase family 5 protein [Rhypophila decipiens]